MDSPVTRGEMMQALEQRDRETFARFGRLEAKLEALDSTTTKMQLTAAQEKGATEVWRKTVMEKIDTLIRVGDERFAGQAKFNTNLLWWFILVSGAFSAAGYVLKWIAGGS